MLVSTALLAPGAVTADAATVGQPSATPEAFVPNWDGHTDTTTLSYTLERRSLVNVRIVDSRGRGVITLDRGIRLGREHTLTWDGRNARGRVMPAGSYSLRVTATPRPFVTKRSKRIVRSASAQQVRSSNAATAITLKAPEVAVTGVQLSRSAMGRAGKSASTQVRYALSTRAAVSAAIVDSRGRSVRTLVAGTRPAGISRVAWNGRSDAGVLVADGSYDLVVAASGAGRPTATTRVPLTVDRVAPEMKLRGRTNARVNRAAVTIPLRIELTKAATVTARYGKRSAQRSLEAGTHTVSIPGSELGISPRSKQRTITVRVTAADAAGNQISRSTKLVVKAQPKAPIKPVAPPKTKPISTTPPPTTPTPGTTSPTGLLPWPTAGIVTSEFGMRSGRMHTGLDIADPTGTPIHPVAPGTVSFVGVLGGYGNLVIVEHPSGLRTYYAHMSKFGGHAVGAGVSHLDVLGLVGCTGNCTGPHVHFETRISDVPKDPRGYLVPR
ncbi:MAG: peptidoglycan DD-metalloendopeptidase family protein [Gaiellales bacterium]